MVFVFIFVVMPSLRSVTVSLHAVSVFVHLSVKTLSVGNLQK